jgi:hypothetical protein
MKRMFITVFSISCIAAFMLSTAYASRPASKEWVLQQIAANQRILTAADWNAVCTSGSPTSASGCYGNVSSAAFTKVSDRLGGFTTYANINPVNVSSSVFIKTFFGGTNIPANDFTLHVNVSNSAARCGLVTQAGMGLSVSGLATETPSNGNATLNDPNSISVVSINNAISTNDVYYNEHNQTTNPVLGSPQSDPLYLICAGYNPNDGSTAAPINISAT